MLTFIFILYNIFEKRRLEYLDLMEQEGLNTGLILLGMDVVLVILFKVFLGILKLMLG